MGNISDAYVNTMLDAALGDNHVSTFPATPCLALFTSDPKNDGSGDEVLATLDSSDTGYDRVPIINDSTRFPDATSGIKRLAGDVFFPTAALTWGIASHWALMDSSTPGTGNVIFYGKLGGNNPPNVVAGSRVIIPSGTLIITIRRSYFA